MKNSIFLLFILLGLFSGKSVAKAPGFENYQPALADSLSILISDAGITHDVPGLKITLQDETIGTSQFLPYNPKTMTARFAVDTTHRYTLAIDAPGYTPYRKYFAKVSAGQQLSVNLRQKQGAKERKYLFIVVDKEQHSVVPDADIQVFDQNGNLLTGFTDKGNFAVMLPETGDFNYLIEAREYESARGPIPRSETGLVEVGLQRRKGLAQTQTIAFVAQDAFTKIPIAARFRINNTEANTSATVTTAEHPEFGTELKLNQSYLLEVKSDGYQDYSRTIQLDAPEAEPIKPRVVLLDPLVYAVTFVVLDAKTLQPVAPYTLKIIESGRELSQQAGGGGRIVMLSPGKKYDIRVDKPGYESFERSLSFEVPASPTVLQKSILLAPAKSEPVGTAMPSSAKPPPSLPPDIRPVAKPAEAVFDDLKVGEAMRLDNVYFDQSSYLLRPESYPQLDKLVNTLKRNSKLKIEIAGHTDNVGDARLNKYLSENRAKVISSYLVNHGVPESRLRWNGYGQTRPVAANDTEENKAQNRRVEFVVLEN